MAVQRSLRRLTWIPWPRPLAYPLALVLTGLACVVRLQLDPLWGMQLPFFTFYPAIIIAALVGGVGAGVLAATSSTLAAIVFWLPPARSLFISASGDQVAAALFLATGFVISALVGWVHRGSAARARTEAALTRSAERLRLLHEADRGIIAATDPAAVAAVAVGRLRELLEVPRAVVVLFDFDTGEAEWLATAGHRGTLPLPGIRYPLALIPGLERLRAGEVQVNPVDALPAGLRPERMHAAGIRTYLLVPMMAGGVLIGTLSLGGAFTEWPPDLVEVAQEVATQLAIAIEHARLGQHVQRYATELEAQVRERTAALEAAQAALVQQERLALLGQVAASISHELRNPLGVINNSVYFLKMIGATDERQRKHHAIIEREVQTATEIVGGLLDYTRVRPPTQAPVDLNDLVREAIERTERADLVTAVPLLADSRPLAAIDRAQILLVLGNLMRNAAQAMPEGGTLTIQTGVDEVSVWVAVTDTGAGIAPEVIGRIFDPLFTTKAKGIGLGLALAKRLVEQNGGTIAVASTPGRGSRFEVTFAAIRSAAVS